MSDRCFFYGELDGPFACKYCPEEAYIVVVSAAERAELPSDRFEASRLAFVDKGVACCSDHLQIALEETQ